MKHHPVWKSFVYAYSGLAIVYKAERNFRIELGLALVAVILGVILQCSFVEWEILTIVIASVLGAEVANSLLERLIDAMNPRVTVYAKEVKDITAAAVSILAVSALIVGVFLFFPKIVALLFA